MSNRDLVEVLSYVEPVACVSALLLIHRAKQLRQYGFLAAYLFVRIASFTILTSIMHASGHQLSVRSAYILYFYLYWASYAVEAMLGFGIIFSIYNPRWHH